MLMKTSGKTSLFFLSVLLFLCGTLKAQEVVIPKWQIGAFGGLTQYHGDISNKSWTKKFSGETKLSFGFLARHHFNSKHGLGVHFQHSSIYSAKEFKSDGITVFDRKYDGSFTQISLQSFLNFSNFFFGESDRKLELYGTLGIGYLFWNGTLSNISTNAIITNNSTASAVTKGASFPATIGAQYALTPNLKLMFEASLITALTDEVDFYRDGYQYDILTSAHFGLTYNFGGGVKNKKTSKPSQVGSWEPETPISVIDYEIYNDPPVKQPVKETLPQLQLPAKIEPSNTQTFPPFEFRVQIYAKTTSAAIGQKVYRNVTFEYPIIENRFNGLYRYSTGSFRTYSEAEAYARTMQNRGIFDAFVVAYSNNERISITSEMKSRK
jgi:hypothetical protein